MDDSTKEQLSEIADLLAMADNLRPRVWLRGGWAMDFFLGRVTRIHLDIDWFALADDWAQGAEPDQWGHPCRRGTGSPRPAGSVG